MSESMFAQLPHGQGQITEIPPGKIVCLPPTALEVMCRSLAGDAINKLLEISRSMTQVGDTVELVSSSLGDQVGRHPRTPEMLALLAHHREAIEQLEALLGKGANDE